MAPPRVVCSRIPSWSLELAPGERTQRPVESAAVVEEDLERVPALDARDARPLELDRSRVVRLQLQQALEELLDLSRDPVAVGHGDDVDAGIGRLRRRSDQAEHGQHARARGAPVHEPRRQRTGPASAPGSTTPEPAASHPTPRRGDGPARPATIRKHALMADSAGAALTSAA